MAGFVKFLFTRPVFVPVAAFSAGLFYGTYDISFKIGQSLGGREDTVSSTSAAVSFVSVGGTALGRVFMNPHKDLTAELWKNLSLKSLSSSSKKIITYNVTTITLCGIAAGFSGAYALEKKGANSKESA